MLNSYKRVLLSTNKPLKDHLVIEALVLSYNENHKDTKVLIFSYVKVKEIKGWCGTVIGSQKKDSS